VKQPSLLACGELLWDLLPGGAALGGAPVNFGCHAALQGAAVSILSAVGNDSRGNEALAILEGFHINTSLIRRMSNFPTGTAQVILNTAGQAGFEITANTAWDHLVWSEDLEARLTDADAIYFGTLGQRSPASRDTIRRVVSLARTRNIRRVLDVNLRRPFYDPSLIRESISLASLLKLSDEELPEVASACGVVVAPNPKDTLQRLLEQCQLEIVVLTRGPHGAILVSPGEVLDQPGIPCVVRDTVGAGDSFTAALTVGFLQGKALKDVLRQACETASSVCSQLGAVPQPSRLGASISPRKVTPR